VDDHAGASFGGEQPEVGDGETLARGFLQYVEKRFANLARRANESNAIAR
jgi:hypothetical protein